MRLSPGLLLAVPLLAACSSDPILRYPVPPVAQSERIGIAYGSLEVREVSLPTYAALEEIAVELPTGAVETSEYLLWADDPARGMTLQLSRALSELTGARVAPEPWPFADFAAVRLEIRVEDMLAGNDGQFRLAGQYFVAPDGPGRDRAGTFALAVPLADTTPGAIAAARADAVSQLAQLVAREGLR